MVSYFSLMVMLLSVHAVFKWGIASLCPAFVGSLSPVLYQLVVPARHAKIYAEVQIIGGWAYFHHSCENSKLLSRLLSVLSLSRKFISL
jgi:hypothetical protein